MDSNPGMDISIELSEILTIWDPYGIGRFCIMNNSEYFSEAILLIKWMREDDLTPTQAIEKFLSMSEFIEDAHDVIKEKKEDIINILKTKNILEKISEELNENGS